jgi:hypothetical protein
MVLRAIHALPCGEPRVPLLYVIDCICRTCHTYHNLFRPHLDALVRDTMMRCSPKHRARLERCCAAAPAHCASAVSGSYNGNEANTHMQNSSTTAHAVCANASEPTITTPFTQAQCAAATALATAQAQCAGATALLDPRKRPLPVPPIDLQKRAKHTHDTADNSISTTHIQIGNYAAALLNKMQQAHRHMAMQAAAAAQTSPFAAVLPSPPPLAHTPAATDPLDVSSMLAQINHLDVVDTLYPGVRLHTHAYPTPCGRCGRRTHTTDELTAHHAAHEACDRRNALLQKKANTSSLSQSWYWPQSEWIQAADVIFGVQRGPTGSVGADGAASSTQQSRTTESHYNAVPADQPPSPMRLEVDLSDPDDMRCPICQDTCRKEWSDEDENWMYVACTRPSEADAASAWQKVQQLESALATSAASHLAHSTPQTAAVEEKDAECTMELAIQKRIFNRISMCCNQIVHHACFYGVLRNERLAQRNIRVQAN